MMQRAALWLDKMTKQASRRQYTYRRGAQAGVIEAVPGRLDVEEFGESDAALSALHQSAVAVVDELRFEDGSAFLPEPLDELDWRDEAGELHTFLVIRGGEARCWRYTDQTRTRVRLFLVEKSPNTENP